MAIGPLPGRLGRPADSAVKLTLQTESLGSLLTMSEWQLATDRLKKCLPNGMSHGSSDQSGILSEVWGS